MTQAPWDDAPAPAPMDDALAPRDGESGAPVPSPARALACVAVGLLLFVATLGIGYLAWSVVTWGSGQTPAQRMLGLRCLNPDTGRPPGRADMAARQVLGWCLDGQLLIGLFFILSRSGQTSVGDFFMGTIVVDEARARRRPGGTPLHPAAAAPRRP